MLGQANFGLRLANPVYLLRRGVCLMKAFRYLLLILVVGFAVSIARADTVDPKITIGGGGSCASINLTSLTQAANGLDTSCTTDFVNQIANDDEGGVTLTQIVINVTSAFDGVLSCATAADSPFFGQTTGTNSCTFFVQTILLEALTTDSQCGPNAGLAPGCKFGLSFDNEGGTGFGATVDLTISQTVIPAPEPASALLLLVGAGALAALRKRRQTQA